ncbi:MAG: hypothetical protein JWM59_2308 [Verrucomicrobiales bacterium]|nr:hypothetical protein [Verrucomicrobiales bacterium]
MTVSPQLPGSPKARSLKRRYPVTKGIKVKMDINGFNGATVAAKNHIVLVHINHKNFPGTALRQNERWNS